MLVVNVTGVIVSMMIMFMMRVIVVGNPRMRMIVAMPVIVRMIVMIVVVRMIVHMAVRVRHGRNQLRR